MSEDHRIRSQPCPKCGHWLEAAANMTGGGAPGPGDLTLCINCAAILRFLPELDLEEISLAEVPWENRADVEKVGLAILVVNARRRTR